MMEVDEDYHQSVAILSTTDFVFLSEKQNEKRTPRLLVPTVTQATCSETVDIKYLVRLKKNRLSVWENDTFSSFPRVPRAHCSRVHYKSACCVDYLV